jgi:hypothetical protein
VIILFILVISLLGYGVGKLIIFCLECENIKNDRLKSE